MSRRRRRFKVHCGSQRSPSSFNVMLDDDIVRIPRCQYRLRGANLYDDGDGLQQWCFRCQFEDLASGGDLGWKSRNLANRQGNVGQLGWYIYRFRVQFDGNVPIGGDEPSRASVSGVIETVVASGVGDMTEALVDSRVPVADSPPNMAPVTTTTTMAMEAAMKPVVKWG